MAVDESKALYRLKIIDQTMSLPMGSEIDIFLDRIVLGRATSANLRYSEKWLSVSDEHAVIKVLKNTILLEQNRNVKNQILVNGKKIQKERRMKPGDTIQLSVGGPRVKFISVGSGMNTQEASPVLVMMFYAVIVLAILTVIFLVWWLIQK